MRLYTLFIIYCLILINQFSCKEIKNCHKEISSCSYNDTNLTQFYVSSLSNNTNFHKNHKQRTSRVNKKHKIPNRRRNSPKKLHRHSTRVLFLKPSVVLLPPFENDAQNKNISTLNPFIINILSYGKTSATTEKLSSLPLLLEQEIISFDRSSSTEFSEQGLISSNVPVTEPFVVSEYVTETVTTKDINSSQEVEETTVNIPFPNTEINSTLSTLISPIRVVPPPLKYLLPPLEDVSNVLGVHSLEDVISIPESTSSSSGDVYETSSFQNILKEEEKSVRVQLNETIAFENYSLFVTEANLQTTLPHSQRGSNTFNNTLLAPDIASLGMKIFTSQKGFEMVKKMSTTLSESKQSDEVSNYDELQNILETAESGDIRSHNFNKIYNTQEKKNTFKDMLKVLKKSHKPRDLCNAREGYVADPTSGCQIFYICLGSGAGEPMLCPNGTLFNQEVLVCDWWYNVECIP